MGLLRGLLEMLRWEIATPRPKETAPGERNPADRWSRKVCP